ncbi:putative double-stranded RNA/RNA-DNA hybrid binding protein [Ceratocystis lukuohia]|uniref:Double-stranded RNA/RNA-DNA hybrid binding protein n=1 Tax=Ceratocystis lukuohia TaxID=2019550 RepID=A0ABR4MJM8_9PEZI
MTLKPTVAGPSMPPRKWLSKEKEAEKHREEVDMATVGTLIAYSDGSKDAKGNTGAGWVTTMDGTTLETGHSALGKWVEVADAEAYGACEAAKRAVMHTDAEEIWICLDNQGVVDRLRNPQKRNSTSQDIIDRTKRILNTWKNRKDRRRVQVLWVPGHVGLEGNEQADAQAKLGCLGHIREPRVSLAGAKRWRRNQLPPRFERRATKEWTERNWDTSWQPGRDTETLTSTMTVSITNAHANAPTASSRKNEDTCGRAGLYQDRGARSLRTSY